MPYSPLQEKQINLSCSQIDADGWRLTLCLALSLVCIIRPLDLVNLIEKTQMFRILLVKLLIYGIGSGCSLVVNDD